MIDAPSHLPVIIGVGQSVARELSDMPEELPTPVSLAVEACRSALENTDAGNLARHIDTVAFVRLIGDSVPSRPSPIGRCDNLPRAVSTQIGANPKRATYSIVGGQVPQQLVNEACNRIATNESEVVLLSGAEAIGASRHVVRNHLEVDWNEQVEGEFEDRGLGADLVSNYEVVNGVGFPPQVYGAFENAWRFEHGLSKEDHRLRMSRLFAPFSEVAASHKYAQFPRRLDAEFLATPSYENYEVADPYLKWHVAQDAVNQGAAVILTSVGKARELGVPTDRWVFPLSGADVQDKNVSLRQSLTRSDAMAAVLKRTTELGQADIQDIEYLDLYSCFPCAVQFACDAMLLDPFSRQLTQTGGLPFFGGAGNNYSMHAIASIVERLRADRGSRGLVLANGGFLSKESAGLYSTTPNLDWQPVDNATLQAGIDSTPDIPRADASEGGRIESYSVVYTKAKLFLGYVFCRTEDGGRFLARTATHDEVTLRNLVENDLIGQTVKPTVTEKRNLLELH
jgi:acetyl-CoA C-acetyltransferase